jgi:hypothetical protein
MNNDDILLEVAGVAYYIDFDNIEKMLTSIDSDLEAKDIEDTITKTINTNGAIERVEIETRKYHKGREVDLSRYETYRTLLEIVLSYNDDSDDALGLEMSMKDAPISFKIAFNTLVKYGILKQL